MINNYLDYLCCPNCKSDLKQTKNFLLCGKCTTKLKIEDGIVVTDIHFTSDMKFSLKKWDQIYIDSLKSKKYLKDFDHYKNKVFKSDYKQLNETKIINKKTIFLELGCGMFFSGNCMCKKSKLAIGVDFSYQALKVAKKLLEKNNIKNYLLIQSNISSLPIKSNTVDFVVGSGVIEHIKDTQSCLNELYRILKKRGISYNSVPLLNIGSLTYRQLWGNIPNFPILKQLAEFVHIKLLKGKHMMFGYELSFTKSKLMKLHNNAGFKKVKITKLDVEFVFLLVPKFIRKFLARIANSSSLFWPMVKVIATK